MAEGAAEECTECHGAGVKITTRLGAVSSPCFKCHRRGYTLRECGICPVCNGRGAVYRPEMLEVKVERGMPLGHRLVFPGMSDVKPGYRPGDVVFVIEEKNEQGRLFQRIGASNDLIYTHYITLHEALAGTVFPVIHMDNRVLLVRPHECGSPGTIKTGDVVLIKGEGMPIMARHPSSTPSKGDLHIVFKIIFPSYEAIAGSEEKKEIFMRVLEDLALLQPREPIEAAISGRNVVPVFATKTNPELRPRRKPKEDVNKCHQQ